MDDEGPVRAELREDTREGLGEGDLAALADWTLLARALLVVVRFGVATAPGPWLAK